MIVFHEIKFKINNFFTSEKDDGRSSLCNKEKQILN